MKKIIAQYQKGILIPQSEEDREALSSEFKQNQLVKCEVVKVSKVLEPSVIQLNLLHACFQLVADNTDNPRFDTKEKVKFACKVALDFRHHDRVAIRPDGTVIFEYRSFSFSDLQDMERLKIIQRAFEWMANLLGITTEELIKAAKEQMK